MNVKVGDKTTLQLPSGLRWPAIAITDGAERVITIINRETQEPMDVRIVEADFISQRQNLAGETYKALTTETVQFGFKPRMTVRFNAVIGLDVTEDGTLRKLEEVVEEQGTTYAEWQAAQFEARQGATAAADL